MDELTIHERRRHARYEFAYPVEFKFFSPFLRSIHLNGFLENISVKGVCIQFRDKYGLIKPEDLSDSKVKISIFSPKGENLSILSSVRWNTEDAFERSSLRMGMEFDSVEEWQTEVINNLIAMKNKDTNMMLGLWDQYKK
jgi:hypothetical protein